MALNRDFGGKTGSGPMRSEQQANIDRRERLRQLALETIDLSKDPYFMKNHLGSYECKLCLTLHNNEGSYLAHTQGKRHQTNLARRAAREMKDNPAAQQQQALLAAQAKAKRPAPIRAPKIGLPGYRVTKRKEPVTGEWTLTFEIEYAKIDEGMQPRHRFMSSFEQRIEARDKNFQYLIFAAPPYENIAFKVPNLKLARSTENKSGLKVEWAWDRERLLYTFTCTFSSERAGDEPKPDT